MQNNFLEFGIRQNIKHAPSVHYGLEHVSADKSETNQPDTVDTIGGIFRDGSCGWIVVGAHIEIVSLKNGNRIAEYTFGDRSYSNTFIAFVTEVNINQTNTNLLAIGVHCSPTTSCIYLFAVNGSQIIHAIEIDERLTSCCFIEPEICADSALSSFDGCVIVGTETGKVLIVDLFVESCVRVLNGSQFFNEAKLCRTVSSTTFKSVGVGKYAGDSDELGFGVQLEEVTVSGSALSILCLQPLLIVAVGFEDGKMLLYDLCSLDAFHIAHPPGDDSPLEKLTFIEPADDPRACVYVWSFHSSNSNAIAVLHSLTYEMKIVKPNGNGFVYKNFERCTPRLTMPIFEKYSKPISCQSITKFVVAEENYLTLCQLSWTSSTGAFVCVFDLNQWYKQQMPDTCDWRSSPTFLAIFPLGKQPILDVWMNGVTVTPFSSLNRPEEHFYPSSLSFDCTLLTTNGSAKLHWLGLQNEALEHLNHSGPYAILEPNRCFAEMVRASLIPQFTDYSYDMNQSLKSKREFLLSIALEYNCVNLLKRCANAWADGSHLSKNPADGMSLSTLTDWIWNRATSIKECCNEMCVPLFDHSGNSIEPRSRKVLLNFSRQLKRLFLLMDMIVTTHQKYIPGQVLVTLQSQRNSICMATEYQEVLQWLLNTGLLPEVSANQPHNSFTEYPDSSFDDFLAIPYPYETLKQYYASQRRKFCEINPNFLVPATKSCRILYIDSFIEHECNSAVLRSEWRKGCGDGLYPPASLQTMLRTLLVPGVPTERKYMLFVYLFMDLSTVLREKRYANVIKNLIKFPAVFKMDPGLIKITQAFWNVDHGEFELAIEEIISPLAQDQNMSMWQRELLIGALILNDVPHLALRALHAPGAPISPSLEIRTLLANDLVADAFQVQRMKRNRDLLFEFFQGCHEQRKWHYLLNLSLNDKEEECLGEFLRSIESSVGENVHFIYLLRRSKYLEAVTFIDDLHQRKRPGHFDLDTPNTILSTYRLTMAPSIRKFSDLYYSLRDDINVKLNRKAKYPKPLSTHLSQGRFDVSGGVYHQSLVHTEQTSATYWENQEKKMCGVAPSNVPFLHGLRVNSSANNSFDDQVCYPEPFVPSHKRRLNASLENDENGVQPPVAKRQRLDHSNVNSTLLTSFKAAAHQAPPLAKNVEESDEIDDEVEMLQTTLSTPVVQSHKIAKKAFSLLDRIGTPQSILKSRSSLYRGKSVSSIASRRSVDSDRSIRFNLPEDGAAAMIASTPIVAGVPSVPDVFNFGITQRPSIHSDRSLNEKTEQMMGSNDSPPGIKATTSMSSGRKRVRSISPESSSNVTQCIDVQQPRAYEPQTRAYEPQPRELFVSEESSDQETDDIVTESIKKPKNWSTSETLDKMSGQETVKSSNTIAESIDDSVGIAAKPDRTADSIDQFIAIKSSFLPQVPTNQQTEPVVRIIPIEIEPRTHTETETKFECALEGPSLRRDSKVRGRSSIGLGTSNISLPLQRNILTDSYNESNYSATLPDESVFQPRNLLTSTLTFSESALHSTTATVSSSKVGQQIDDIETVQIEDSDEDSSIVCDTETKSGERQTATITDDVISVECEEKAYASSTPFTAKLSQSRQFEKTADSFTSQMFRKKNILTDSTYKGSPRYSYSSWDQSSMFKPRNLLTDSTFKDDSAMTSDQSTLNPPRGTIRDVGNSLLSRKGNESKPIVIDITDRTDKDPSFPAFNDVYAEDIYDLSSEVGQHHDDDDDDEDDDDYDVDDYESDSPDDVIDISSGTEDVADPPIVSKNQKSMTGKLDLPPCNTLGKKERPATVFADISKNTIPVDDTECSDVSFLTASENSIRHLTASSIFGPQTVTLHSEVENVSHAEPIKESEIEVVIPVQSVPSKEDKLDELFPASDFIGVMDDNRYDVLQPGQNPVTITYPLQQNLLADDELNEEVAGFTVQYVSDSDLVSDLNNALIHPENVDISQQPLMQTEPEVISCDTLAEARAEADSSEHLNETEADVIPCDILAEVSAEANSGENLNDALMISQEPDSVTEPQSEKIEQKMTDNEITSDETLIQLTSTSCDLNTGIIVDTATIPDTLATSQQEPETESAVDTYTEQTTEATNENFNEAIISNESEAEAVQPMEIAAVQPIEIEAVQPIEIAAVQPIEMAAVDSIEIAAVEPIEIAAVQPTEIAAVQPTAIAAVQPTAIAAVQPMEVAAVDSQTIAQNIESSQDEQVVTSEGMTLDIDEILESAVVPEVQKIDEEKDQPEDEEVSDEKPSTSIAALKKSIAKEENVIPNTPKRRLRSNSNTAVETPTTILTRRRSSSSFTQIDSTASEPIISSASRMTRAKSEAITPAKEPARSARANSELKAVASDNSLPAMDSIESTSESVDTIPKKVRRLSGRNVSSPVNTPDKSSTAANTRVTRSRTRSIAEDDDTASVASGVSGKSTRSIRSTRSGRAKSHIAGDDDDGSSISTPKKSRAKQPILPVISEDLSQEGAADSLAYEDTRRLTRGQRKFIDKMAETAKMVPPPTTTVSRKRQRKDSTTADQDDDDISDTGSVASAGSSKTNASAKSRKSVDLTPVRQSERLRERGGSVASRDSDNESVGSVARSTRSRARSTSSKK